MRALAAVLAAAPVFAAPAAADTADTAVPPPPPFVAHVSWVSYDGLPTLRVYPTPAGRDVAGTLAKTAAQTDEAWAEVLALAPGADTPGMRAQFVCHWNFAEFAQPGKTSWDLEPWRPAVTDSAMVLSGCNPGGAERG